MSMFDPFPVLGGDDDDAEMRALMELLQQNPELAEILANSGTLDERMAMTQEMGQPSDFVPLTPLAGGIAAAGEGIGAVRRLMGRHEREQMLGEKDKARRALLEAMRGMGRGPQMQSTHRTMSPALMQAMGTLGEPAPRKMDLPLPAEALGEEGELLPPPMPWRRWR